ncbi:MAG: preprotein translocase subunit SecY [Bacillota bacterium]
MFETLQNAFKVKEIRQKIFITLGFVLLYRVGCFIPVPGISASGFSSVVDANDFLGIMSAISGGSLSSGTLFAMGISPYINASIIMQLLSIAIPALERLSKQGDQGRKKIAQYTRYLTLVLGIIQVTAILISAGTSGMDFSAFGTNAKWITYGLSGIIFMAGVALTMWIGERITEYGIGNGMSLLIFVGILSTAGVAIAGQIQAIFAGDLAALWALLGFLVVCVVIFGCIVTIDLSVRNIPVQYAKQVKGRKMYGGQSSVIPIKVNGSGVLPLIFAFAILSMPQLVASLFWPGSSFEIWWATWLGSGTYIYSILLALLIVFFAYFYAMIQFNPEDVARNIQANGGFIQGIRPGKPTSLYLAKISNRITLFGAIYLALVALIPSILFTAIAGTSGIGLINAFSTTGLLIVVSVALEFNKQIDAQLMMRHYKGFLK